MAAAPETAPIARVAMVEDDRDTRARLAASIRAQGSLRLVAEYATGAEALAGPGLGAPAVPLVGPRLAGISRLGGGGLAAGRPPGLGNLVISILRDEAELPPTLR